MQKRETLESQTQDLKLELKEQIAKREEAEKRSQKLEEDYMTLQQIKVLPGFVLRKGTSQAVACDAGSTSRGAGAECEKIVKSTRVSRSMFDWFEAEVELAFDTDFAATNSSSVCSFDDGAAGAEGVTVGRNPDDRKRFTLGVRLGEAAYGKADLDVTCKVPLGVDKRTHDIVVGRVSVGPRPALRKAGDAVRPKDSTKYNATYAVSSQLPAGAACKARPASAESQGAIGFLSPTRLITTARTLSETETGTRPGAVSADGSSVTFSELLPRSRYEVSCEVEHEGNTWAIEEEEHRTEARGLRVGEDLVSLLPEGFLYWAIFGGLASFGLTYMLAWCATWYYAELKRSQTAVPKLGLRRTLQVGTALSLLCMVALVGAATHLAVQAKEAALSQALVVLAAVLAAAAAALIARAPALLAARRSVTVAPPSTEAAVQAMLDQLLSTPALSALKTQAGWTAPVLCARFAPVAELLDRQLVRNLQMRGSWTPEERHIAKAALAGARAFIMGCHAAVEADAGAVAELTALQDRILEEDFRQVYHATRELCVREASYKSGRVPALARELQQLYNGNLGMLPQVEGCESPEEAILRTWERGPREVQRLAELCENVRRAGGYAEDAAALQLLVAPVKGLARGYSKVGTQKETKKQKQKHRKRK